MIARRSCHTQFAAGNDEMQGAVQDPTVLDNREFGPTWIAACVVLPALALAFPFLLDKITDFSISAEERQQYIITLLLGKRVYLYSLALVALDWCAKRSEEMADLPLGERLRLINEGMLGSSSEEIKEANREVYASLDEVDGRQQAAALPLVLIVSLLVSFAFLQVSSTITLAESPSAFSFPEFLNALTLLSNGAVCLFFTKVELERAMGGPARATLGAALVLTAATLGGIGSAAWPIQNVINFCICVTASRLLSLSKLSSVIIALVGLTLYDVIGVVGTAQLSDNGQSIMEAVARAKFSTSDGLAAGTAAGTAGATAAAAVTAAVTNWSAWRPGLVEVVVGGRVTDALGLGDIIFPALLAGWCLHFDKLQGSTRPLYKSCLFGYAGGSLLSELFQSEGGGQPQLLFLVPSMLLAVLLTGLKENKLSKMMEI